MRSSFMTILSLVAGLVPLILSHGYGSQVDRPPLDIGSRKQLLFDDALTASKIGFVTTMNPATRMNKPIMVTEKAWEEARFVQGPSVVEDEGMYKMWYSSMDRDKKWYVSYATSKDGMQWTKPNLGRINFKGSKENNIVFAGTDSLLYAAQFSVFKDPTDTGARKFKMVYGSHLRNRNEPTDLPKIMVYDYSEARWKELGSFISAAYSPTAYAGHLANGYASLTGTMIPKTLPSGMTESKGMYYSFDGTMKPGIAVLEGLNLQILIIFPNQSSSSLLMFWIPSLRASTTVPPSNTRMRTTPISYSQVLFTIRTKSLPVEPIAPMFNWLPAGMGFIFFGLGEIHS